MPVELATGYVSILPSAQGLAGNLTKLLGGPAAVAGQSAGAQAGKGLSTGIGKGAGGIGAALSKGVIVPFAAVAAAAIFSAKSVEDAENTIIRTTGATGKAADGLKESFRNVAGKTPADFKTVATALAEVHQRTGLYGKALEDLTLKTVTFNRITKDTPLDIRQLTRTMAAFGIPAKGMSAELDQIFKVSQKTGVPLADLVSTLDSAGPVVRQFGIPIGETAALLATLDKAGIATNQIIPGLRKAMVGFAKDGREPGKALRETIGQMQDLIHTGDVAGARKLAVQIFGARGAGLVDAAIQGKLHLDDLKKSIDGLGKGKGILETAASTATLGGKLGVLRNQAELALSEFGKPILEGLVSLLQVVVPAVGALGRGLQKLPAPLKDALAAFIAFTLLKGPVTALGTKVAALAGIELGAAAATNELAAAEGALATSTEAASAAVGGSALSLGAVVAGIGTAASAILAQDPAALSAILGMFIPDSNRVDREWAAVSKAERKAVTEGVANAKKHGHAFDFLRTQLHDTGVEIARLQKHIAAETPKGNVFDQLFGDDPADTGRVQHRLADLTAKQDALKASLRALRTEVKGAGGDIHGATAEFEALGNIQVPTNLLQGLDPNQLKAFTADLGVTQSTFGDFATQFLLNSGITVGALKDLTATTQQTDQAIVSSFTSATSVVGAFGEKHTITGDEFIKKQTDMVRSAQDFANKLKIAAALGVDQGLVQELAKAGPAAAGELDGLLAAVKGGGLAAINQNAVDARTLLDGLITDVNGHIAAGAGAGAALGNAVGQNVGAGIANSSANSELDRLVAKLSRIEGTHNFVVNGTINIKGALARADGGIHLHGSFDLMEHGGRVRRGQPVIVGEKRPELFVPDSNGTIVPDISRNTLSGLAPAASGGNVTVVINGVSVFDYQAADRLAAQVAASLKRNGISGPTANSFGG